MANERPSAPSAEASEQAVSGDADLTISSKQRSAVTNVHDAGSDANETEDGLNSTDELTRHLAEDVPTGANERADEEPVFDRGDSLPRV